LSLSQKRSIQFEKQAADLETEMTYTLLQHAQQSRTSIESLNEAAQEGILKAKIKWENHLSTLATIGNNAPFIGLFGTVLGIIQAFHDLSKQASGQAAGVGASSVTAGISEALIATAVGILVAIPAVMAYNYFTRKLKIHLTMAEAQKSYLISVLSSQKS
jgi:biopolymer transport protein ExbB